MKFNEDMIRRQRLPWDVRELLHDLCYDHDGRDRANYKRRAQEILKAEVTPDVKTKLRNDSRDRRRVAKPVSRAQKPALSYDFSNGVRGKYAGKVSITSNGFKCRGCNSRVRYEGDFCGECICEDDCE
jgi:hypothetical protein